MSDDDARRKWSNDDGKNVSSQKVEGVWCRIPISSVKSDFVEQFKLVEERRTGTGGQAR